MRPRRHYPKKGTNFALMPFSIPGVHLPAWSTGTSKETSEGSVRILPLLLDSRLIFSCDVGLSMT
jgi:hypothetical protein